MDLWIGFFKIFSMISAAVFGALGLLTKYKDENGKITRWGKIALSGILLSSTVSLALYTLETSKAKAAAVKARADAEAQAQLLQNILHKAQTTVDRQEKNLEETNRLKLGLEKTLEQQEANLKRTNDVAQGMETSIATQQSLLESSKQISGNLGRTATSIGQTYQAAQTLLEENIRRVDYFEVELSLLINPLVFRDAAGKSILSEEALNEFNSLKNGMKSEASHQYSPSRIADGLKQHYSLVRNRVFAFWEIEISLNKPQQPYIQLTQQKDEGIASFTISFINLESGYLNDGKYGYKVIPCKVRYSIPTNRYAGFRKYSDLNGAGLWIGLRSDREVLYLQSVRLSVATGKFIELNYANKTLGDFGTGGYWGALIIPSNYF